MARLRDIVIDCGHAGSLARFWAAALDDHEIATYDEAELERLRANGIDDVDDDPTVLLLPRSGGPRLWLQSVGEPKTAKNRVHLDLVAADTAAELARLSAVGARLVERFDDHLLLADPQGNEFCLFEG